MKIEVGKEYKTRCGETVLIVFKSNHDEEFPFLAINTEQDEEIWYTENGKFYDCREDQCDLISEAPKKVKVKRWVNVFQDGDITTYDSKEEADGCATDYRTACKHIEFEVEEGEGL